MTDYTQLDLIDHIHSYNLDVSNREVYILGEEFDREDNDEPGVDYRMANRLIKNLRILSSISKEPILIHLKTCGGDYIEGMAIFDTICQCQCPIIILSYTHARSMSGIILQAAKKRVLMPNSYFMYHGGTLEFKGDSKSVMSQVDFEKKVADDYISILAKRVHKSDKYNEDIDFMEVKEILKNEMDKKGDVMLTAKEAVEMGLADEIFDGDWKRLKEIA